MEVTWRLVHSPGNLCASILKSKYHFDLDNLVNIIVMVLVPFNGNIFYKACLLFIKGLTR